jgi:hypothetical protein
MVRTAEYDSMVTQHDHHPLSHDVTTTTVETRSVSCNALWTMRQGVGASMCVTK